MLFVIRPAPGFSEIPKIQTFSPPGLDGKKAVNNPDG
jgi:hypothetical protein